MTAECDGSFGAVSLPTAALCASGEFVRIGWLLDAVQIESNQIWTPVGILFGGLALLLGTADHSRLREVKKPEPKLSWL